VKTRPLAVLSLAVALAAPAAAQERLRLSTTTSTENSGLLQVLLPPFEKANGVRVDVIAVGTGKALKLGESGDVDVVLTHDPGLEEKFVTAGFGVDRRAVMHNDFVVVGPRADPAGLEGAPSAAEAFRRLHAGKAPFVSRGDESGTHQKEKSLWKAAGVKPEGAWYLEAGQGMGETLQMADQKQAYTLIDRATYLVWRDRVSLVPMVEGDSALYNVYHVLVVNPANAPRVNHTGAEALARFLVAPETQGRIAAFGRSRFGQSLFVPDAGKEDRW